MIAFLHVLVWWNMPGTGWHDKLACPSFLAAFTFQPLLIPSCRDHQFKRSCTTIATLPPTSLPTDRTSHRWLVSFNRSNCIPVVLKRCDSISRNKKNKLFSHTTTIQWSKSRSYENFECIPKFVNFLCCNWSQYKFSICLLLLLIKKKR